MKSLPVWVFSVAVGAGAATVGPAPASAASIDADKLAEPALAAPESRGDAASSADVTAYLRKVHEQVHKRWADNFLRLAAEQLAANNPVNEPGRTAVADLILSADGRLISVTLAESGGFPGFDDAVTEVVRDAAPFPEAPVGARSDDDTVHLRWRFARDQRRCAEVALVYAEDPIAQAVPKLLRD